MRRSTRIKSIGAMAGVALALGAAGNAGATDVGLTANARLMVTAGVAVPVKVSSASVGVRETRVGPVYHDGKVLYTPEIAAGTKVEVHAAVHAAVSAGSTVAVTTSDYKPVVVEYEKNDEGQHCFGIGVDLVADVTVSAGANAWTGTSAKAWGSFDIKVGGKSIYAWQTRPVFLNGDDVIKPYTHSEKVPVQTGADVCLPAEVSAGADVFAEAVTDAIAGVSVTK